MIELKKYTINQIKSKEELGSINTKFLKINLLKRAAHQIFTFYKNMISLITMLFSIYNKTNSNVLINNILLLAIFSIYFYFSQKYLLKKRKSAWKSTENTLQIL